MYFETTKRTYYRFPSTNSISRLDSRYYFPDKPRASGDDTRFDARSIEQVSNQENHFNS